METTAKDLFAKGDYRAAEQAFLAAAKDAQTPAHRSLQLSNASQCDLKLLLYERAVQYAREAISLDPRNAKAHYRLATAYAAIPLPQKTIDAARRCCDIAMANARAFALIRAGSGNSSVPEVVGFEVISALDHPVSVRAADLLRHVSDSQVFLVANRGDIDRCCEGVAVLAPNCQVPVHPHSQLAHIVGLDDSASIHAFSWPHALVLQHRRLSTWCVRFEGACDAMICTLSDLALIDCSIIDHSEHAILVAEDTATALIAFCTLNNCVAGIEVREGGSATVVRSEIRNMSQKGIIAYGGARSVLLEEVLVENVGIEGVQCLGPRSPAIFDPFGLDSLSRGLGVNPIASAVAEAAATAARETVDSDNLVVTMRNCNLRRCGIDRSQAIRSGITIDQGASAQILGCLFTQCGMAGVFIKGGCDVTMQHCRIDHGNSGDAGVQVDINYDGKVNIKNSVFVGKTGQAIIDGVRTVQSQHRAAMRAFTGARSAPIQKHMNRVVSRQRNAPSIESLRNELELAGMPSEHEPSSSSTELPNLMISGGAGALYRQLGNQYTATEYPIGNTYGKDVLWFAESEQIGKREALVVLAACGDIRNLVETTCALEDKQLQKVRFVLNDISIWILARDIILLQLACVLWPIARAVKPGRTKGKRANLPHKRAARIWLHAWGSIALTPGDRSALDNVLTDLAAGKLPEWLSPPSPDVCNALVSCWLEWASCKRTLREVRNERDSLVALNTDRNVAMTKAALAAGLKETEACALLRNAELVDGGGEKVNPTLLTSGLHYNMYESSIYRAIDMRAFIQGDVTKLHAAACDVMNTKGPVVARALLSGVVNIEIQPGDLTHVLGSQCEVDALELSNALDYISKPACLISAARCLSRPGGVLSLHTMMAHIVERNAYNLRVDLKEYLLYGANSEDLTEVLGLRLMQIGNEEADSHSDGINSQSRWVYQAKSYDLSQTGNQDNLRVSMMNAAKAWCRGPCPAGQSGVIGIQIAAWPSAVAALRVVAASMGSTGPQLTEVVTEMCNTSPVIRPFELELNAHAVMMNGEESDLVVATLALDGLHNRPIIGMHVHQILQLGSNLGEDNEETLWLFDVFEFSASRGVCEVIVRKDDVLRMSALSARLCIVRIDKGILQDEEQTATCLIRGITLKTRELSVSEITAMRKVLVPDLR